MLSLQIIANVTVANDVISVGVNSTFTCDLPIVDSSYFNDDMKLYITGRNGIDDWSFYTGTNPNNPLNVSMRIQVRSTFKRIHNMHAFIYVQSSLDLD